MNTNTIPRSSRVNKTVGVVAQVLLGANSRRRGITIFPPNGGTVFLSERPDVTTATGLPVGSGIAYHLCAYEVGDWIQREIHVVSDVANVTFGVLEVME